MIKHYSFDLWMTLIRSDSRFKVTRATYIYEHFNPGKRVPFFKVEEIIKSVDNMCSRCNELVGKNIDTLEMYYMVLTALDHPDITRDMLLEIYAQTERMFFTFPPHPYDEDTLDVLHELKSRKATLSLVSNTGFIKGGTLRKYLDEHFYGFFDTLTFSDECGYSKPSPYIYSDMQMKLNEKFGKETLIEASQILHVGDNSYADGLGAEKFGMSHLIINSNSNRITDLL